MDEMQVVAISSSMAAIYSSFAAAAAQLTDGRAYKRQKSTTFTIRNGTWQKANEIQAEGWFVAALRVNYSTFDKLVELLTQKMKELNLPMPKPSAYIDMRMRVAMTLEYLSGEGTFKTTAHVFGVAKSEVIKNVNKIMDVLCSMAPDAIRLPSTSDEWYRVARGFKNVCGFPFVAGAIDGSLFEIERPFDYEGWMCRKGYAAINMQATVDSAGKFMEISLRPGSHSDKLLWKMSNLGGKASQMMPPGMHFVGDAGYTLATNMMTPYPISEDMDPEERHYNKLHSRTRIAVERAFGMLKGRWRILRRVLNMKSQESCSRTIVACVVLHNLCVDLGDVIAITQKKDGRRGFKRFAPPSRNDREAALEKRDRIRDFLFVSD